MQNLNDGFLIIHKPKGISSRQLVDRVKRFTTKKVGHTGTLDPLASGMMVVCIGEATKFSQWIISSDKAYHATIQLGSQTETDDAEGDVTHTSDISVDKTALENALIPFKGLISQVPPKYSAIHINGKRAYKLARTNQDFEIPSRKVKVLAIHLQEYDPETSVAEVYIHCQSGTYIRSIARDLGTSLGCYAHLKDLHRLWVSPFENIDMLTLEQDTLSTISLDTYFDEHANMPKIALNKIDAINLSHGRQINLDITEQHAAFYQSIFLGIISKKADGRIQFLRLRANLPSLLGKL